MRSPKDFFRPLAVGAPDPVREIPARPQFDRAFQVDHEVLRREERGVASWLTGAAYGTLGAVALAWLLAIGAAVTRFERLGAVPA